MTDEQPLILTAMWPDGSVKSETFQCEHRNVFACPNHGALARSLVRPLPRIVVDGYEQAAFLLCPREAWPVRYQLTRRGHCAAHDLEFDGEAWE